MDDATGFAKAAIVPPVRERLPHLLASLAVVAAAAALAAAVANATAPAGGGLHKCSGGGSGPVYQDRPCAPGQELRDLEREPATLSVIPFDWSGVRSAPVKPARAERTPKPRGASDRGKARGDANERRHVREGMSDGEVLARLGPPDLQAGKTGRKMRWTYLPAAGDAQTVTLLSFEDGKLVSVERSIVR